MSKAPEIIICVLILGTVAVIYLISQIMKYVIATEDNIQHQDGNWIFRLVLNLLGYGTIFVPGFLIFHYVKKSNYLDKRGHECFSNIVRNCLVGPDVIDLPNLQSSQSQAHSRTFLQDTFLLSICFFGLQISFLTWGVLQEKIMTQEYIDSQGNKSHFRDSQFLVFVNRILAFALSGSYILLRQQPKHNAPLYKYVFCSFSNILSSWCQYEALKFVSFPTQVLAKASKIIPVMVVGKIISRTKYEYYEYLTAFLISIGMSFFLFGSMSKHQEHATTVSGIVLLASYMMFDSFTSNWQGALFNQYGMTSVQMMCGVNLFSCLFTTVSLIQQGGFVTSLNFMTQFPKFMVDCLLLSVCSAAGQLFIYFTISSFGPVVFTIIMTIRQALAVLLSCVIYRHDVTMVGIFGIVLVFLSVFLRIYCSQRLKALRRHTQMSGRQV